MVLRPCLYTTYDRGDPVVRDMASVSHVVPFHVIFEMSTNMLCCDQSYLFSHMLLLRHGVLIKSSNFVSDHSYFRVICIFP